MHIEIDDDPEESEFDEWLEHRASEVDSEDDGSSVAHDDLAVAENAHEEKADVVEPSEPPRSSGEGRLRVVGSKSIDPSDVSDTMAKLRSAWNSGDSSKR